MKPFLFLARQIRAEVPGSLNYYLNTSDLIVIITK